jgi:hypothetical protein
MMLRTLNTYKQVGVRCVVAATAVMIAYDGSATAQQKTAPRKCSFSYEAPHDLTDLIEREGFAFTGYDALCRRLENEGVAVSIESSSGVLQGRAYGWAVVSIARKKTKVYGSRTSRATSLSNAADTPEANKMALKSVNIALDEIARDPGSFIKSVASQEASLRRTLLEK